MGAGSPKAEFHPNLWWDCITPYQSRVRGNPLAHDCRMDGVWTTKHFVFFVFLAVFLSLMLGILIWEYAQKNYNKNK